MDPQPPLAAGPQDSSTRGSSRSQATTNTNSTRPPASIIAGSNRSPTPIVPGSSRSPTPIASASGRLPTRIVPGSSRSPTPIVPGSSRSPTPIVPGSSRSTTPIAPGSSRSPTPIASASGRLPTRIVPGSSRSPTPIVPGSSRSPTPIAPGSSRSTTPIASGSGRLPTPIASGSSRSPDAGKRKATSQGAGRPLRRNAALEVLRGTGGDLLAIERSVQPAPPRFADKTLDAAKRAIRGVVEYMVGRDILLQSIASGSDIPLEVEDQEMARLCREKETELRQHGLGELKDNLGFWALLFHRNAVAGRGKLSSGALRPAVTDFVQAHGQAPAPFAIYRPAEEAEDISEEAQATAIGLPAPQPEDTPMSLSSAIHAVFDVVRALRLLGVDYDERTFLQVRNILRYNAVVRRWFPTSTVEKQWVSDKTVDQLLAAIWSRPLPSDELPRQLSFQAYVLAMVTFGFRQGSWIDLGGRHSGRQGRYLRWGNVKFSLAGYEAGEPVIIVEGRLLGGKRSARAGDKHVLAFQAATGQASASLSFALALVSLAMVSKVMPHNFQRALQEPAYGESLVGRNNRPFAFWPKDECKLAPVFVTQKTSMSAAGHKHPSDSAASGLGDKYMPLNTVHTGKTLVTLSAAIGLDGTVGAAVLRRTWSLHAQTRGSLPAHRIAGNMEHSRDSLALHEDIYVPTQRPEDTTGFARPELASSSALAQMSIARAGAVEQLPRELPEENVDELSHALDAYLLALSGDSDALTVEDAADGQDESEAVDDGVEDGGDVLVPGNLEEGLLLFEADGHNDSDLGDEDGRGSGSSNGNGNDARPQQDRDAPGRSLLDEAADHLVAIFPRTTGLPARNLVQTLRCAQRILDKSHATGDLTHPWDTVCEGKLSQLLHWLENYPAICESCCGKRHTTSAINGQWALAASKCLVEKHGLSLCFLCPARVPVADAISHVNRCLERRCRTIGPTSLAFEEFCCVKDRALTSFYLCPFVTCLNPALRFKKARIPDAERHLMATHVKTQGAKGNPMTGEVAAFAARDLLLMHMAGHVFDQEDNGSCAVRVPEINGQIVCAVHSCTWRRGKSPATTAAIDYICHLVNDHGLPVLRDGAKEMVQSVQMGDFRGRIPGWKLNDSDTIFATPTHKSRQILARAGRTA